MVEVADSNYYGGALLLHRPEVSSTVGCNNFSHSKPVVAYASGYNSKIATAAMTKFLHPRLHAGPRCVSIAGDLQLQTDTASGVQLVEALMSRRAC